MTETEFKLVTVIGGFVVAFLAMGYFGWRHNQRQAREDRQAQARIDDAKTHQKVTQ